MIITHLKDLLESKKISINKLSSETGLSRPTLTSLLNNESKGIQFDTLEKILDYFDIAISDFFSVYNEEVIFTFFSHVPLSKVKEIENSPFSKVEENFVQYNPSQVITYTCMITADENSGEEFSAAITPILDNQKVVAVGLVFYRADQFGEQKAIHDVKAFIKKLDSETMGDLVKKLLSNWYKRYKLVSKNNFSDMFIVNLTLLDEQPISYPVLVDTIQLPNKEIAFDLYGYKISGIKEGNSDFSSAVTIKEVD
ncbi:TPA: helix-turn-helix domain-containing protein [Streptococcus suis]|uniref:helix-turn-helix domain-containing protein n=1 Tax=Streptococcus suis TaxID=1307 RepID=UPI00209B016A|nr:helix-turn-helix transcriptional regulator [Streptococcus suis]MCO8240677.1 helix-turn-helix transcriptional regulator [Streptococcus suis]